MKTPKLMIAGPVGISDEVREALAGPLVAHYGPEWVAIHQETVELLQQVFQTQNDLHLLVGSGSAGVDAALGSLLSAGEKILVAINGFFGQRMATIARAYGLDVVPVASPSDQPIDPDAVRACLAADGDIQLVGIVHHETSTGVLNPLQEIANVAREFGLPILVDAIASMGGISVPVDGWGLDVVVAVGNKCLGAPPGLALISVSPRAWGMMESRPNRGHGWFFNLETWREYAELWAGWHPFPTTMPTPNILALRTALKDILKHGLESHYQRHVRAAARVRDGLIGLGFELYLKLAYACPLITAVKARPEFTVSELHQFLLDEHNIMIAGGIAELRGKIFRVGHMGLATSDEYVEALLAGVRDFLGRRGF